MTRHVMERNIVGESWFDIPSTPYLLNNVGMA